MSDPMIIQLRGREAAARPKGSGMVYALGAGLALVLLAAAFGAYALFVSHRQTAVDGMDPEEVVGNVGLLMLLPTDEQPTIATVTNLDSLAGQPFFKNAHIGDVVLMYPKSQRAILYSPSENMIIEVAPIVLGAE